ncbi:ECF transporter S component [Candidatus Epulonipiscium viviparus]|uniref:ECF transporter S component n=1 Tax=Candidatus Epulonipiscium viviparus TaxID=420336 RepID=UPI0027380C9C|nr:ECF transporter S component [Candidatus Epulopiscium viviparus]
MKTQDMVKIALLSAIAAVLMQLGIKLPMLFPSFLEVDFSEVPALIGILTISPASGIIIITLKNLLKVVLFGTSTAFVGEFANWIVSVGYILPIMYLVRKDKSFSTVVKGISIGILTMAIIGGVMNYFIMLPFYANAFGMPMEAIVEMGSVILPAITDKFTLVLFSIVPFNIFKGLIVSVTSVGIIKSLYPVIRKLRTA